jgi:hypothetical protein
MDTTTNSHKGRWTAGITPYAEMGYWNPDCEPKDTDVILRSSLFAE